MGKNTRNHRNKMKLQNGDERIVIDSNTIDFTKISSTTTSTNYSATSTLITSPHYFQEKNANICNRKWYFSILMK